MKVIFLDRDGVINKFPGHGQYVTSREKFELLPGVREAIAKLTEANFSIFVISNQAGVTKGLYSYDELDAMTRYMKEEITKSGGTIVDVLYCTHTNEDNCDCRKPKTGLLKKALEPYHDSSITQRFFIGDSIRDIQAGKAFHCTTILVLTGKEALENKDSWKEQPDYIAQDLPDATTILLQATERNPS